MYTSEGKNYNPYWTYGRTKHAEVSIEGSVSGREVQVEPLAAAYMHAEVSIEGSVSGRGRSGTTSGGIHAR